MLKVFNGQPVVYLDSLPTIIHNKKKTPTGITVAKGSIVQADFTLRPCVVVADGEFKAHAPTLREALLVIRDKKLAAMSLEDRAQAFVKKFPTLETSVRNQDLSNWHHTLTGSCRVGRDQFMSNNGIDPEGESTILEFIKKTKNAFGADAILLLEEMYNDK